MKLADDNKRNHPAEWAADDTRALEAIRKNIVSFAMLALLIMGLPNLVANIWNDFTLRQPADLAGSLVLLFKPGTILYLVLIGFFAFRKRLTAAWLSAFFVSALMIVGMQSLLDLGFIGSGMLYFMLACAMAALLFDGWRALLPAGLSIAAIAWGGWLWLTGRKVFYFDPAAYAASINTYVIRLVTVLFFLAILVGSIWRMKRYLIAAVREQQSEVADRKRAEAALRESEERNRNVYESAPLAFVVWDRETRVTDWNERAEKMFGWKKEEMRGRSFFDTIIPKSERVDVQDIVSALLDGSLHTYSVNENITKDGRILTCEWNNSIMRDISGAITGVLSLALDITDRKQAEEQLRESEANLQAIMTNTTDIIASYDRDIRLVAFNRSCAEVYRRLFNVEIHPGLCTLDLFPEETREFWTANNARALAGESFTIEFELPSADGRQQFFESSFHPIRQDTEIAGFLTTTRDITARKRTEDALRESEEKLAALFASMTEMVVLHEVVFDQSGIPINYRITDCNAAYTRITGIRREDAVGRLAHEVYGTDEPPYLAEFSRVGITGEPYQYETFFAPMDKHFSISVVSPGPKRFATVTTDITEARRIQAFIDAKNRELEQLVYVASHDLRTPLVNVDGFSRELDFSLKELSSMLDAGREKAELEKWLRAQLADMDNSISRIRSSTGQMDDLLKGLLKISRLGRAALLIEDLDMNGLIGQVASSFAFRLKESGIQLTIGRLPSCRGDAVQVTQVFSNLLDNAVKYLDPARPGRIRIGGKIENSRAAYRVEDNGIGIAESNLERVFDLFCRLDPAKTAGEGLGLTIARQALGRMEGEVRAESKPGQGSIFTVILQPGKKRIKEKTPEKENI